MAKEDFQEKPENAFKANFKEIGRSGTYVSSNQVLEDYLDKMNGTDAQDEFHRMTCSDAQLRKIIHAVNNPIKSAKWSIEPASDEQKDLDAAALMEQIIIKDLRFKDKLDEILEFPWKGHAVFEVVHKNRNSKKFGPYTGLANLAFRSQRTLDQWKFDKAGFLTEIHQKQSGDLEVDTWLDAKTLMIFFNEQKGNDTGFPFCRMMYGNYKRKLLYKELQAIGIERGALNVPHLELPEQVDMNDPQIDAVKSQLEAFTHAQNAFFITPAGWKLTLNQTNTFNPANVQTAIKAENEEMAGAVVAMFLEMGIGGNSAVGSSTSESLSFFRDGIEYFADKIADKFSLDLIPHLCALNYGDTLDDYPKLVHSGIADEAGKELMEIVTGYVKDGVIGPDEQLEDHVRRQHNLPKKAEGEELNRDQTKKPKEEKKTPKEEVELSEKAKKKSPAYLIEKQAEKVSMEIRNAMEYASSKYIADYIRAYKKQKSTDKIVLGGVRDFKKSLKRVLADTARKGIESARKEVPAKRDIELKTKEKDLLRLSEKFGDISDVKLSEYSELPAYAQVLIAKQVDLISEHTFNELKSRLQFSAVSADRKSNDYLFVKQKMEETAEEFIESNQVDVKGTNVASLVVNEGRNNFFFQDDVLEEIHSFTFMNIAPKSAVCRELAGTTFNTNDAASLMFTPPLHHNCKSYLRANLKTSKGVDDLEISSLSPSAEAKKSITL